MSLILLEDAIMADYWDSITLEEKTFLCKLLNEDKFRLHMTPAVLGLLPVLEVVAAIAKGPVSQDPRQSLEDRNYERKWRLQLLDRLTQKSIDGYGPPLWLPIKPRSR